MNRNLGPYWFQGALLLLSKFPLLCKTGRRQLSRQKMVLMQAYKEKAGMGQGRTKKVEADEEKEAVGCRARAKLGSAGTHQLSGIPVSPRGLRDSSGSRSKALSEGMSNSVAASSPAG